MRLRDSQSGRTFGGWGVGCALHVFLGLGPGCSIKCSRVDREDRDQADDGGMHAGEPR